MEEEGSYGTSTQLLLAAFRDRWVTASFQRRVQLSLCKHTAFIGDEAVACAAADKNCQCRMLKSSRHLLVAHPASVLLRTGWQ
jgi:hypothetical protein